jgi:hypothetical protein
MVATPNNVERGMTRREGFTSTELEVRAETAASAVAAQAKAAVEARYIMALRNPRDWDTVRLKLLKECDRPGFAEVARYAKPVGQNKVEGFSVRFAEAALRCMGNVMVDPVTVYDDEHRRILKVSVLDLESNVTYATDLTIEKTVERRKVGQGQEVLGVRVNSYGDKVYLVRATEDEFANKQAALVSKALRNSGMRILPGDIAEEACARVLATLRDRDRKDPDAERKKVADAFSQLGIMPADLAQYLGHDLAKTSPAELVDLRAVYSAIRDGEAKWIDYVDAKPEEQKPAADSGAKPRTQSVAEKVKAKNAATAKPASDEPPPPSDTDAPQSDGFAGEQSKADREAAFRAKHAGREPGSDG